MPLAREPFAQARTFFQLMRQVDAHARQHARPAVSAEADNGAVVRSHRRPAWLRVQQTARMNFATSELQGVDVLQGALASDPSMLRVDIRHFGLFAPYGPLPVYITEHTQHEHRAVFEHFFGNLTGGLAWLHYKAWSNLHPVVGCDAGDASNAFVRRLAILAAVTPRGPCAADRDRAAAASHIRRCRTHFAGAYCGQHRPLPRLAALLARYFQVAVAVLPRTGGWQDLAAGAAPARGARPFVGRWLLGSRVHAPQTAMTIVVGPVDAAAFAAYHRGRPIVRWMVAIAEDYAHNRVDARVMVDVRTHPGMNGRVGQMRMGVDTWASPTARVVRLSVHESYLRSCTT